MRASFAEANPAPVKAVLAEQGRMTDTLRLPLAPLSPPARARVLAAYASLVSVGTEGGGKRKEPDFSSTNA